MKNNVVAVGYCCVDVYKKLDKWYPTGNGIDWGIHLARLGVSVSAVSAVGSDSYGAEMLKRLNAEKIDTSHLRIEEGDTCQNLMDLKNGVDRFYLEEILGVMKNYHITQEEIDYVAKFDYLHTDLFGRVLEYLPFWRSQGVKVIMDFSIYAEDPQYQCTQIFPNVDYVFFSYDGEKNEHLYDLLKRIYEYGPTIVTATLGDRGSLSYDGNQFYEYGIVYTEVKNTVGAGDSYIAGYSYGILNDWSIPECMKKGAEISSVVVSQFDPY